MPDNFATDQNAPAQIFDPRRQQAKLARAHMRGSADNFLWDQMAADIADRLSIVTRDFQNALIIGPAADYADSILAGRKCSITFAEICALRAQEKGRMLIEKEILPFETGDFDLIICFGLMDSINDLPGFLFQLRHLLRPDGLLLGNSFGAGSLATLKRAMLQAEGDRASPHIHPQIDLHNMSQLIQRAGFALPVVDQDALKIRYSSLAGLLADLRNMGLGNIMVGPRLYFGKAAYIRLQEIWNKQAEADGKVSEIFNFLHITAWSPSPQQPKPARRGSAKTSLADVLKPPKGK